MRNITIFVDESGTLPDPNNKIIVVSAIGINSIKKIDYIIKTAKVKNKKPIREFKFYNVGQNTKKIFFDKIAKESFDIFILIVEKQRQVIPDTPENFAILTGLLLENVLYFYSKIKEIIFDRHFHKGKDTEEFTQILERFLGVNLPEINHVDSRRNKRVNIVDMIAGATLAKETARDPTFYEKFRKAIIQEIRLSWPEAKRRYIWKIKNLA